MSYDHSVCIVVPASDKATLDAAAIALGHADPGGETYAICCSPNGQEPSTHYGMHTWAEQTFVNLVSAALAGNDPPGMEQAGQALRRSIVSIRTGGDGRQHFDDVLSSSGLAVVEASPVL